MECDSDKAFINLSLAVKEKTFPESRAVVPNLFETRDRFFHEWWGKGQGEQQTELR